MINVLITGAIACGFSWLFGRMLLPVLRALKAGQSIREIGPTWHNYKAGTPMMGGLMFIAATLVCLLINIPGMTDYTVFYVLALGLCFGFIGFLDDYEKIRHHQNLGLTSIQKALLQMAVSAVFLYAMYKSGRMNTHLYIPFFDVSFELNPILYIFFAMFVMVGCWCVLRVLWIQIMVPLTQDIRFVFWSYPITWTVSVTILTVYFFKVDWLHKGQLH